MAKTCGMIDNALFYSSKWTLQSVRIPVMLNGMINK